VAVTANHLTTGSSTVDGVTYNTATITPTPNRLVTVAVLVSFGNGTGPVSVSGCGLNWELVDQTPEVFRTQYLFRAMGAAPTAGPITITAPVTLSAALWQVVEFNGVDTSGVNGSGAIAQSVSLRPASSTSANVPLPAAVSPNNAAYAVVGVAVQEAPAPGGGGWIALRSITQSNPVSGFLGEASAPALQNITASWTTAAAILVVGAEIRADPGAVTPTGAASGSVTVTGAAVGVREPVGVASGTVTVTGSAVGGNAPVGVAAGTVTFSGAAQGARPSLGAAAGVVTVTGAAVGTRPSSGTASGTVTFVGAAVGAEPVVADVRHTYGRSTLAGGGASAATLSPPAVSYAVAATSPGAGVYPSASLYPGSASGGETTSVNAVSAATLAGNGVGGAALIPQPVLATLQTT
jgi:hypothetical protein